VPPALPSLVKRVPPAGGGCFVTLCFGRKVLTCLRRVTFLFAQKSNQKTRQGDGFSSSRTALSSISRFASDIRTLSRSSSPSQTHYVGLCLGTVFPSPWTPTLKRLRKGGFGPPCRVNPPETRDVGRGTLDEGRGTRDGDVDVDGGRGEYS